MSYSLAILGSTNATYQLKQTELGRSRKAWCYFCQLFVHILFPDIFFIFFFPFQKLFGPRNISIFCCLVWNLNFSSRIFTSSVHCFIYNCKISFGLSPSNRARQVRGPPSQMFIDIKRSSVVYLAVLLQLANNLKWIIPKLLECCYTNPSPKYLKWTIRTTHNQSQTPSHQYQSCNNENNHRRYS